MYLSWASSNMYKFTLFSLCLGIFFLNEGGKFATGQDESIPPRQFQYIAMDHMHRGSFNNTDCLRELLNCWEVVKPDIVCSRAVVYESVCGVMKRECHEKRGLIDQLESPLFESFCQRDYYNQPT